MKNITQLDHNWMDSAKIFSGFLFLSHQLIGCHTANIGLWRRVSFLKQRLITVLTYVRLKGRLKSWNEYEPRVQSSTQWGVWAGNLLPFEFHNTLYRTTFIYYGAKKSLILFVMLFNGLSSLETLGFILETCFVTNKGLF